MRRNKNSWLGVVILVLLISSGVFRRFMLTVLLILAALIFLIVKLVKSDKPGETGGTQTNRENVNPYSRHENYQPAPKQTVEKKPEPAPTPKKSDNPELELVLKQGRGYVQKIEALNEQIPDFKVSARIKQIEVLTEKIFDYVEGHPEDLHRTRQMLSYYLPTTVKLLERYVELQGQGLRMGNIDESMTKVEELLDKLAVAFQTQLDDLFADDLVDITAEIKVMEQMLASEGLTGTKDF